MKINSITSICSCKRQDSSCQIQFGKVFDVRKLEHLYCPVCASTMFTKEQSREFCSDLTDVTGEDLVRTIEKYENMNLDDEIAKDLPVFNSRQQEILDRIKIAALENDDLYLDELTNILGSEVAQKYSTLSTSKITQSYTPTYHNSLPTLSDEDYADVFFLNCRNRKFNSYEIAQNFIKEKYPTIEHLIPVSRKGKNEDRNYMYDCSECNRNRGSMPFYLWIKQIPNFEENLQIQMNQINRAIQESKLDSKYHYYPKRLSKTIKYLSKGKINLVV